MRYPGHPRCSSVSGNLSQPSVVVCSPLHHGGVGRGSGVGRSLGTGAGRGVGVGRGVEVAVAVGVGVAVGSGVAVGVAVGVGVGDGVDPVMVKSESEISKNTLPTASTFILAVVVGATGIVTISEPSLEVLVNKTVGKVCPPSVDNEILTSAQLIGGSVVLFTSQVIV